MAKEYVKGTVVQVIKSDANGQPTDYIERDPDSQLWHISGSKEPKAVRDEEVSSIVTETHQTHEG